MTIVECISCGSEIRFSAQPNMGQSVTCADCDSELEVVWLDPVELDWPFDEDDYDDDDYKSEDY